MKNFRYFLLFSLVLGLIPLLAKTTKPPTKACSPSYTIVFPKDTIINVGDEPDSIVHHSFGCAFLAVSYEDKVYGDPSNLPYTIHRRYTVIDWLAYIDYSGSCGEEDFFEISRNLFGGAAGSTTVVLTVKDQDNDLDEEFWFSRDFTINNADDIFMFGDDDYGGNTLATGVTTLSGLPYCDEVNQYAHVFAYTQIITVVDPESGSLVWPGDADLNGVVDHFDLLPIGLSFGEQGIARPNNSITWNPQPSAKWGKKLSHREVDLSNVDTNGNGVIDAKDTKALAQNWQLGHSNGLPRLTLPELRTNGVPLFIEMDTVFTGPGQWFPLQLGTAERSAVDVYGLAFSVVYDPEEIKTDELVFQLEDSWLGTLGKNLLLFQHNDPITGRLDVAITRTDQSSVSGFGKIGKVKVTIEDLVFKYDKTTEQKIKLSIEDVVLINHRADLIPIAATASEPTVKEALLSNVFDPQIAAKIQVFPQPAQSELNINYGDLQLKGMQLLQADGRMATPIMLPSNRLSTEGLPTGFYYLKVFTETGVALKKIIIAK